MNGILVINKPQGLTSHDVVSFIRTRLKTRRVGHAGTLDPLATGVLIILLGKSTKLFDKFSSYDKGYEATLRLGMTTDTADIRGSIIREAPYDKITEQQAHEVFKRFTGDIAQIPPMYSAVKINGKRLYKLARKGIEVKRPARRINIRTLNIIDFSPPDIKFYLECSKGTYVRKLAEDVGEALGCGGCISQINRTRVGPFSIKDSLTLEDVHEGHLRQVSF